MQFGKIHGIALAILGIILLGIQTMYYMMPKNVISGPTAVSRTAHHQSAIRNSRSTFSACRSGHRLNC